MKYGHWVKISGESVYKDYLQELLNKERDSFKEKDFDDFLNKCLNFNLELTIDNNFPIDYFYNLVSLPSIQKIVITGEIDEINHIKINKLLGMCDHSDLNHVIIKNSNYLPKPRTLVYHHNNNSSKFIKNLQLMNCKVKTDYLINASYKFSFIALDSCNVELKLTNDINCLIHNSSRIYLYNCNVSINAFYGIIRASNETKQCTFEECKKVNQEDLIKAYESDKSFNGINKNNIKVLLDFLIRSPSHNDHDDAKLVFNHLSKEIAFLDNETLQHLFLSTHNNELLCHSQEILTDLFFKLKTEKQIMINNLFESEGYCFIDKVYKINETSTRYLFDIKIDENQISLRKAVDLTNSRKSNVEISTNIKVINNEKLSLSASSSSRKLESSGINDTYIASEILSYIFADKNSKLLPSYRLYKELPIIIEGQSKKLTIADISQNEESINEKENLSNNKSEKSKYAFNI